MTNAVYKIFDSIHLDRRYFVNNMATEVTICICENTN